MCAPTKALPHDLSGCRLWACQTPTVSVYWHNTCKVGQPIACNAGHSSLILCPAHWQWQRQACRASYPSLTFHFFAGSGRVLLAVCNPLFTLHTSTPFQKRITASNQQYSSVCCWHKQLKHQDGSVSRQDVHRPLDALLHDLARRSLALEWCGA